MYLVNNYDIKIEKRIFNTPHKTAIDCINGGHDGKDSGVHRDMPLIF